VLQESRDLMAEADELHAFLETLAGEDWSRPTAFKGWTPWDVVAHLHFYDRVSLVALEGRAFAARRDALVKALAGATNTELAARVRPHARRAAGALDPELSRHGEAAR
jgi:uncharacterized protein (TIGR03083 family)